ncbi:MAG: glycosyltransferase family 2 protein [Bacteroidaceae bacterium]|nr:glycosyltransferase family 2 protein [Bacteroidaceae bacterium]
MVSFIVLNYNTPRITKRCVDSIVNIYGNKDYEIIIVDNHSTPENYAELVALTTNLNCQLSIVTCQLNTGFGLGNMWGANQATGHYLCFLNSDVQLVEDCITPLRDYLATHPEAGVITPQQYRSDGSIAFSFRHKMGIRRDLFGDDIFEHLFPKQFPKRSNLTRTEPFVVSEINGSFMMFRSDVFWQIGGFDTNIFLFHEEYDIARRLELHGYQNIVYPTVRFLHAHGATTKSSPKCIRQERYISKIYCYSKYHHPLMTLLFRAENILLKLFSPKNWYLIPVFLRGNVLALSMRPSIHQPNPKQ